MPAPLVLVAEDDARVLELLQIAFTQDQFRVITAVDGEEAIRRALAERPDVVVLDVRMPKRNGFEVCDHLRHDPEDPNVPILLLSASGDTDVRIEGLARGADDFLSKPFSPKELVARARRMLVRVGETRAHRRRATDLERDLGRAHEESRRAQRELARERRLRELAYGLGRDLHGTLDLEDLAARTLRAVQRQMGCGTTAWLSADEDAGESSRPMRVQATGGDASGHLAGLALAPRGELALLLTGLGRPVLVHELERWPRLSEEIAPFVGAGVCVLAPLRGSAGVEALLVADERLDGAAWSPEDREALGAIADLAATAHRNARRFRRSQDRELELAAERAQPTPRARAAAQEASEVAASVATLLALPGRERGLLRHAVAFGAWGWGGEGRALFDGLERLDPTCRVRALRGRVLSGETLEFEPEAPPAERQAALLAGLCARYQVGRGSGRSVIESWQTAISWVGSALDPALGEAVRVATARRRRTASDERAA